VLAIPVRWYASSVSELVSGSDPNDMHPYRTILGNVDDLSTGHAIKDLMRRQLDLELRAVQDGEERYKKLMREMSSRGDISSIGQGKRFMIDWFEGLSGAFEEEQRKFSEGKLKQLASEDHQHYPFMMLLSPKKLAVITLQRVLGLILMKPDGVRFSHCAMEIGRAALAEIHLERFKAMTKQNKAGSSDDDSDVAQDEEARARDQLRAETRRLLKRITDTTKRKEVWAINAAALRSFEDGEKWNNDVILKVGGAMIQHLLDTAKIRVEDSYGFPTLEPAVVHSRPRQTDEKTIGMLTAHPHVLQVMVEGHLVRETLHPVSRANMVIRDSPRHGAIRQGSLRRCICRWSSGRGSGPARTKAGTRTRPVAWMGAVASAG
jgi:DNA-directed RNA polymerase